MGETSYLALVADLAGVGVLCLGASGRLVHANAVACRLLGAENTRGLTQGWPALAKGLGVDQGGGTLARLMHVPLIGRRLRLEVRPCSTEGTGCVVLLKDVSVISANDRSVLLATQMRLQRYLIGTWVHDLNGPLNNVQLTIELVASKLASGAADAIEKCGRHAASLKQEIRRVAEQLRLMQERETPSERAQNIDLREELETAVRAFRREAATRRARVSLDCASTPALVRGSRAVVSVAVLSLTRVALTNAVENADVVCALAMADAQVTLTYDVRPGVLDEQCILAAQAVLPGDAEEGPGYLYAARVALEANGGTLEFVRGDASDFKIVATLPARAANAPVDA